MLISFFARAALFWLSLILSMVIFSSIFDFSPRCNDGWRSTSIGTQGACSYHGGVAPTGRGLALIVSIAIGVLAYNITKIAANISHSSLLSWRNNVSIVQVPTGSVPAPSPEPPRKEDERTLEEIRARNEYFAKRSADHLNAQLARIQQSPVVDEAHKPSSKKPRKRRAAKSGR